MEGIKMTCQSGHVIEMNDRPVTNAEKMKKYQDNIGKISELLFDIFYRTEAATDLYFTKEVYEFTKLKCLSKAEKIYQFYEKENIDEIKRMMKFLNTVNPDLAREFIDGL